MTQRLMAAQFMDSSPGQPKGLAAREIHGDCTVPLEPPNLTWSTFSIGLHIVHLATWCACPSNWIHKSSARSYSKDVHTVDVLKTMILRSILYSCCFPELAVYYAIVSATPDLYICPTLQDLELRNDLTTEQGNYGTVDQTQVETRLRMFQRQFATVLTDQLGIQTASRLPALYISPWTTYAQLSDVLAIRRSIVASVTEQGVTMDSPHHIIFDMEGAYGDMFSFHYDMPDWSDLTQCICMDQHNFVEWVNCEKCQFDNKEVYKYDYISARRTQELWQNAADRCVPNGKPFRITCPYITYRTNGLAYDTPQFDSEV